MFDQGMAPKDAFGINPNALENVYAQGYRLYNTGKYIEALHLFRVLILFNAAEPKYILGLAACFHMLKEYKKRNSILHNVLYDGYKNTDSLLPFF